jgi:hypothetical protein
MAENAYQIAEGIIAALASCQSLETYCIQHLGSACTFWLGFDMQDPPKDTQIPRVVIVPTSTGRDPADNTRTTALDLIMVIRDTGKDTSTGITKYSGYSTVSEFSRIVTEEVYDYIKENIIDMQPAQIEMAYPFYAATVAIRIGTEI